MEQDTYLLYLKQTIKTYSRKTKQYLIKQLLENNIARKDDAVSEQLRFEGKESVNISEKNVEEALMICLDNNVSAIKIIENWEFKKDYRYSVLFTCETFDEVVAKVDENLELEECEKEYLFNNIQNPVYYTIDDKSFLKFNLRYAAIHPVTGEELLLKYPIVVVFHKSSKLIEIRYDTLKKVFVIDKEQDTYVNMIDIVKKYIEMTYACCMVGLDLSYMIGVTKKESDVQLVAQYMKMPNGSSAELIVGNNTEYVLPIIGELKSIVAEHQAELTKVPELKDALEQFMFEKEEMSDYPWVEILWEKEIKTRNIHVKFIFDYMNKGYGLIQHYYNSVLVGMERMNYVVEYIAASREDIAKKIE